MFLYRQSNKIEMLYLQRNLTQVLNQMYKIPTPNIPMLFLPLCMSSIFQLPLCTFHVSKTDSICVILDWQSVVSVWAQASCVSWKRTTRHELHTNSKNAYEDLPKSHPRNVMYCLWFFGMFSWDLFSTFIFNALRMALNKHRSTASNNSTEMCGMPQ